jgi:hypothetical protein
MTMRQLLLRESSVEKAERRARQEGTWQPTSRRLRLALRGQGARLAALRVLAQLSFSMFATFAPITFVARTGLGLNPDRLAFLPLAASVFGVGMWLKHRRLAAMPLHRSLALSIISLAVGFGLLGLKAPGGFLTVLAAWGLVMMGQSMFWSSHTTYWMTWLPDSARVDVQGYVGALGALTITIAGPALASWILRSPDAFYWANFALSLVLAALWLSLSPTAKDGR